MSKLPNYFYKIAKILEESINQAGSGHLIHQYKMKAQELYYQFVQQGFWPIPPYEALGIDNMIMIYFLIYAGENSNSVHEQRVYSPLIGRQDSNWTRDIDYCFINVRATGMTPDSTGNFIDAVKLLPVLRGDGIHLAPFFECALGNVYAVDSVKVIADEVVNHFFEELGVSREEQLCFFIDSAHILGKVVGFDLEPHTSQFSRIVLQYPHLFRWLKLNKHEPHRLFNDIPQEIMLEEGVQHQIISEVVQIVNFHLRENGLDSLEPIGADLSVIRRNHAHIREHLINERYWTLPSHAWGGIGLPAFSGYDYERDHPLYEYLDSEGKDCSIHAFGVLTPFKFYDINSVNDYPYSKPHRINQAVKLYASIFPMVQKQYSFDFVRLDYVDHVYNSIINGDWDFPLSDRVTPSVLRIAVDNCSAVYPHTGVMAERMGNDIDEYIKGGCNLLLGTEVCTYYNAESLLYTLKQSKKVEEFNQMIHNFSCSVICAVDSHDTANPLILKRTHAESHGVTGMMSRYFISLFSSCGPFRRPLYEVIGNQDMSSGLYSANIHIESIPFANDHFFNSIYHNIFNLYTQLKPLLDQCSIVHFGQYGEVVYWICEPVYGQGTTDRLIFVIHPDVDKGGIMRNVSIEYSHENEPVRGVWCFHPYADRTVEDEAFYINGNHLVFHQLLPSEAYVILVKH